MDTCAELTLRIMRLVQEHRNHYSSFVHWHFLPGDQHEPWSSARDVLAAAPKPLFVAALVESGMLAVWSLRDLPSAQRDRLEREFANQREYFSEKLRLFELEEGDAVVLATLAGEFTMTVADFTRWTSEYALTVGLSLDKSSVPHTARIVVRPPGGGRPLGMESDSVRKHDHER